MIEKNVCLRCGKPNESKGKMCDDYPMAITELTMTFTKPSVLVKTVKMEMCNSCTGELAFMIADFVEPKAVS